MRAIHISKTMMEKQLKNLLSTFNSTQHKVTIDLDQLTSLGKVPKGKRPLISFTDEAEKKMLALVDAAAKEVAWHGLIHRDGNAFTVYDILVYPQIARSTFVESNDEHYPKWIDTINDEDLSNMRMQGHSHVNMTVTPSGQDHLYYSQLLQHIPDYYIFIVVNKKGNIWANIFDVEHNLIYEDDDIDIEFGDPTNEELWAAQMLEEYVTEHKPTKAFTKKEKAEQDAFWERMYTHGYE